MSTFKRLITQIASGTILSQAVLLLATPLLTRIFEPSSFGAFALFSSIFTVSAGIFSLKYEQSILLPQKNETAATLTALTIHTSAIASGISLITISIAVPIYNLPSYWLCLPICTLLAALQSSHRQWSARTSDYRDYSTSLIIAATANSFTTLILGLTHGNSPSFLVVGFSSGLLISVAFLFRKRPPGFSEVQLINLRQLRTLINLAYRYREFPIHILPTSLALGAATYGPAIALAALYPMNLVGYYALANKLVLLPSIIIGGAISEAFRSEFMNRKREDIPTLRFTRSLFLRISAAAIPTYILLTATAPQLFATIFGQDFEVSGVLVRYIVLSALGNLIFQPFQYIYTGLHRSGLGLTLQVFLAAIPLILLITIGQSRPIEDALLWHSTSTFLLSVTVTVIALHLTALSDRSKRGHHD